MSPMAYVPIRVDHHRSKETLIPAMLGDLEQSEQAALDFQHVRYIDYAMFLEAFLAVREAYPDIHHGARDQFAGQMAPMPAVFFGGLTGKELAEHLDDAWDRAARWFEGHLTAGGVCPRCGGRGRVPNGTENHGCGFETKHYRPCDQCGGVGIRA